MKLIIFLLLIATGFASSSSNIQTSVKERPNILIILGDDVGTGDIPVYWDSSLVSMPNIDKLASNGLTFKDAHSSPACAPSRYMLLSGNYAHRGRMAKGTYRFEGNGNQFYEGQKSIAEVLRDEAGYNTAMFGKWHLGVGIPRVGRMNRTHILSHPGHDWSLPLIQGPQDIGFNSSLITPGGIQSYPYSFFRDGYLSTDISDVKFWEPGTYAMPYGDSIIYRVAGEGDKNWDSTAYNMILVNETTKFIDDHLDNRLNADDPFFTYVALGSVHAPHSPPNHYINGEPVADGHQTRHLDMLKEMDMVVGSLISALEDRNLAEDTIIIFTSDNGGLSDSEKSTTHRSSGKLRAHKGTIYEGGHRVPLIMQYLGQFPAGEERNHPVGLNDIYATICDLVGIDIPHLSAQDSISFANYTYSENITDGLRQELATWNYLPLGMYGNLHVSLS
jgi:arylsulfatase A-like enzyme